MADSSLRSGFVIAYEPGMARLGESLEEAL
jgi:hypothetical protein